jgi:nickel-dependent lactate racemase
MTLPEEWRLLGILSPRGPPPVPDVAEEVRRALAEPIGMKPLAELARNASRIALVVDDASRPTPVAQLLPGVLSELERGGAPRERLVLVTALGVHRPMTQVELSERVGPGLLDTLKWENHECDSADGLTFLGTTRRGTSVWINRKVAEADLVVSIGCIEPHVIASFGGGAKNLVPGVAGRITIAHNHSLNCAPGTFAMAGQPIDQNPMRLDLEEATALIRAPVFVVNAVLTAGLEVVRVLTGDPRAAHRAGADISAALCGVQVSGAADVVIADSHPMDQDLRQGLKALANAIRAVRPGGVLITLARAEEGAGVLGLSRRRLPFGRGLLKWLSPLLLRLVPRIPLRGMGEEDRFFLYFALQALRRATLLLYAPTIPAEVRDGLPFVEFVDSLEAAIARARSIVGPTARVLVFPEGGVTYPVLPSTA